MAQGKQPSAFSGLMDKAKKSAAAAPGAVGSAFGSDEDSPSKVTLDFPEESAEQVVDGRAAPIIVVRQSENTNKMVGLRGRVAPNENREPLAARPASDSAPDFRTWVSLIQLGEVRQTGNVFVTIDGNPVYPGQLADERLGIRLDRIEPDHRILVFEDTMGETIGKRY